MKTIAPDSESHEDESENFTPLTAEQVRQLREKNPPVSPWWVIAGQVGVGLVAALAAWGITGKQEAGWSAGYGALAIVLPAAMFVRALTGRFASANSGAAVVGFFFGELVKIVLSVAMLIAAPRLVPGLHWLALLVGVVAATKVYWVAMIFAARRVKKLGNKSR